MFEAMRSVCCVCTSTLAKATGNSYFGITVQLLCDMNYELILLYDIMYIAWSIHIIKNRASILTHLI